MCTHGVGTTIGCGVGIIVRRGMGTTIRLGVGTRASLPMDVDGVDIKGKGGA